MLVEKHISGSMYKNSGGNGLIYPPLPTPMLVADSLAFLLTPVGYVLRQQLFFVASCSRIRNVVATSV